MADEEMDLCECIWSHEMSMRRLLSWLRQSQAYCTDTECIDDVANLPSGMEENGLLMMSMIVAVVMALFFLRPQSLRNNNGNSKHQDGAGPSGSSPSSSL